MPKKKGTFAAASAAGAVTLVFVFPSLVALRPPQEGYQATFGEVASVDEHSFTLTEKRPEGDALVTVSISEDTTFKKAGVPKVAIGLEPGQQVVVRGVPDEGGLVAKSVNVMPG